jgi:hypothetical protein
VMKMRLGAPRERIRYEPNLGLCLSNLGDESKHAEVEYLSMVSKHSKNPLSQATPRTACWASATIQTTLRWDTSALSRCAPRWKSSACSHGTPRSATQHKLPPTTNPTSYPHIWQ